MRSTGGRQRPPCRAQRRAGAWEGCGCSAGNRGCGQGPLARTPLVVPHLLRPCEPGVRHLPCRMQPSRSLMHLFTPRSIVPPHCPAMETCLCVPFLFLQERGKSQTHRERGSLSGSRFNQEGPCGSLERISPLRATHPFQPPPDPGAGSLFCTGCLWMIFKAPSYTIWLQNQALHLLGFCSPALC